MNLSNNYQRLLKAAKNVGKKYPYYTPASYRVRFQEVDKDVIPTNTMAIDSKLVICYYDKFVSDLSDNYLESIVLHECMHYISAHHRRYLENPHVNDVPHIFHNIAMDMEINQHIGEDNLPKDCILPGKFNLPEGKSYEEYLLMLINNPDVKNFLSMMKGASGVPGFGDSEDNYNENSGENSENSKGKSKESSKDLKIKGDIDITNFDDQKDESTRSQLKAECEESQVQAEAKSRGSTHSYDSSLQKIEKIKYPWKKVFKSLIVNRVSERARGFNYRTYHKRNKHLMGVDNHVVHGSYCDYSEHIELVIGVDISGSMGNLVEKMYGVMKSIVDLEELDISVKILECDTQVSKVIENFDFESSTEINVGHGGGTDMGAISQYVQDQKWNPDLIIIMTDNETGWDPVLFRDKTVVMTTWITKDCPYKQFLVSF